MNKNCSEKNMPVCTRLVQVAGRVEARFEAALGDAELSLAKFAVLDQLMKAGESLPLTRLAERIACVKSNITQLVDRLEADGLVKRVNDPEDRRSVLAAITDEGRRRHELGGRALARAEQGLLKSFKEGELETLNSFLGRFKTCSNGDSSNPCLFHFFYFFFPIRIIIREVNVRMNVKIFKHNK